MSEMGGLETANALMKRDAHAPLIGQNRRQDESLFL